MIYHLAYRRLSFIYFIIGYSETTKASAINDQCNAEASRMGTQQYYPKKEC